METIEKLGRPLDPAEAQKGSTRDAVHIAVVAVRVREALLPGQRVRLGDTADEVMAFRGTGKVVGIIDPYLAEPVPAGGWCWLFLMPKAITGLRHEWTHPLFPNLPGSAPLVAPPSAETNGMGGGVIEAKTPEPTRRNADADDRLRSFAGELELSFEELMNAAGAYLRRGDYLCDGGRFEGVFPYGGFWDDYEAVTGTVVPGSARGSFFTCQC